MPNTREKLIELLSTTSLTNEYAEILATYLLNNGVTVQEWIPVSERLPERFENVLCYFPEKDYGSAVMVDYNESTREEITVFASQFKWGKVTHWMPLPQPPKGEKE